MAEIVINDVEPRNAYTAAGGETGYSYTFPIFAKEDLVVVEIDTSNNITTLSEGSDYNVAGVGDQGGGTITFDVGSYPTGLTVGYRYVLYRDLAVSRTTDFLTGGDLKAETLNREFDKLVMMMQQLERDLKRAATLKNEDAENSIAFEVETAATRTNKLVAFGASGNTLKSVEAASISLSDIDTLFGGLANQDIMQYNGTNWVNITQQAFKNNLGLKLDNYAGAAAPTVNDDADDGYTVGSLWYDTANDDVYHCLDATVGGAVWWQGNLLASDLGAAALKGVATSISAASTDADVATALAVQTVLQNYFKGTKATQSSGTAITASTWTTIAFDTEEYDEGSWHNNLTNNSRITVEADGRYIADANIELDTTANADIGIRILVNGSVVKSVIIDSGATGENLKLGISAILDLSANDYVEMQAFTATGSVSTVAAGTYLALQRNKIG